MNELQEKILQLILSNGSSIEDDILTHKLKNVDKNIAIEAIN
jgi:hypothetical protein